MENNNTDIILEIRSNRAIPESKWHDPISYAFFVESIRLEGVINCRREARCCLALCVQYFDSNMATSVANSVVDAGCSSENCPDTNHIEDVAFDIVELGEQVIAYKRESNSIV